MKITIKILGFYISVLFILLFNSCKTIFKTSPYQTYKNSLENTGIAATVMGQQWLNVGENVLSNPNSNLKLPFKEEVFFREEKPAAVAYQIAYKKSLKIKFSINTSDKHGVYVDFFEKQESNKNLVSAYLKDTVFTYQANTDQTLLLRIQPQLLINEHVFIEIVEQPKLAFPVKNGNNKDIKSFWGVARDGGARKHEGVDIFSKRGTPILAVADGTISRVQTTSLGGKVVWQRLGLTGPSIYYAHLDSQLVSDGQSVKEGEILGLMGNTGNAINTSPHLHFGIYTAGGAINPIDYISKTDTIPGKIKAEQKYLGKELMLKDGESVFPANVLAVSTNNITYQDYSGNIDQKERLIINSKKIRSKIDPTATYLLETPATDAVPIAKLNHKENYSVLGAVNDFVYVEQSNVKGWVSVIQ